MNKIVKGFLAGAMALSLGACSSSTTSTAASSTGSSEGSETAASIAVAMVTDYGDITDQSFNQTTYEACKEWASENGVEFNYYKPASDADADREASIEQAIEDGYNVIVCPGYAFGAALAEEAPMYEDVMFVGLDVSSGDLPDGFSADNLYCAVYQEEIAGYFAGYAAVKLGYTKLGFLGGMAVPAVIRYGYGFVQGADAAAAELGLTDVEIKYTYGNQFFGDADITARMDTWYAAGTEVVFACGGGIYSSAAEAAAKVEGAKVIGVDVDQAATIDGTYGEGITVTSAMKGLAATVKSTLNAIAAGEWSNYGGQISNLGLISENSEENFVALPASTQWNETFSEADYEALVAAVFNGELTISNDTTVAPADNATVVTVTDEGNIK